MKAPAQIESPRLLLGRPHAGDAGSIFARYASDPEVTRFLGWPRHQSVEDTKAFLRFSVEEWKRWPAGPYLIRSRDDGQLLGGTGFGFESPQRAVTGYVLAKDAWGKHPEHRASWRVLEKCGFVREGSWTRQTEFPNLLPGVLQDVLCYTARSQDRSDG